MATEKKETLPAARKDVQKKDKPKSNRPARKVNFKKAILGIGHFFRDVWFELKKVTWPSRKEFVSYSVAVLVFVAIFGTIIFVMDFALTATMLKYLIS